jgi:hypothetical protein
MLEGKFLVKIKTKISDDFEINQTVWFEQITKSGNFTLTSMSGKKKFFKRELKSNLTKI